MLVIHCVRYAGKSQPKPSQQFVEILWDGRWKYEHIRNDMCELVKVYKFVWCSSSDLENLSERSAPGRVFAEVLFALRKLKPFPQCFYDGISDFNWNVSLLPSLPLIWFPPEHRKVFQNVAGTKVFMCCENHECSRSLESHQQMLERGGRRTEVGRKFEAQQKMLNAFSFIVWKSSDTEMCKFVSRISNELG